MKRGINKNYLIKKTLSSTFHPMFVMQVTSRNEMGLWIIPSFYRWEINPATEMHFS